MTTNNIEEMTARLVERLAQDIEYSKTREEHIRVTARANEAAELLVVVREAKLAETASNTSGMGILD
jgi:hypothetical protein